MSSGRNVPSGSASTISPRCLGEAAADRVAVSLLGLEDLAGAGLLDLLGRPSWALLLTTRTSSTTPVVEEALDHPADGVALGVGHQHHRDGALVPHGRGL